MGLAGINIEPKRLAKIQHLLYGTHEDGHNLDPFNRDDDSPKEYEKFEEILTDIPTTLALIAMVRDKATTFPVSLQEIVICLVAEYLYQTMVSRAVVNHDRLVGYPISSRRLLNWFFETHAISLEKIDGDIDLRVHEEYLEEAVNALAQVNSVLRTGNKELLYAIEVSRVLPEVDRLIEIVTN